MKRILILLTAVVLMSLTSKADVTLRNGHTITLDEAHGADRQYPFGDAVMTPAPKGYKAFHIEHYGRHGSRFAYSNLYYTRPWEAFETAEKEGVLTPLGEKIFKSFSLHYKKYRLHMGDLTDKGWEDLQKAGSIMYGLFPEVFKGGEVYACSSNSTRSILSMSAFCLGIKGNCPTLRIREDQGNATLNATNPRDVHNPDRLRPLNIPSLFPVSLDAFQDTRIDTDAMLGRLFTDVPLACRGLDRRDLLRRFFILVAGMDSLDEEDRTDFEGLFTDIEFATMWEVDNYKRFLEYWPYYYECTPAAETILDAADRAVKNGTKGAGLRFGHDHVILPLFFILGIDGSEHIAPELNELSKYFHNYDSPMCTHFYMVFYRSAKNDDILVKVITNGRESTLPVTSVSGPYYKWKDYAEWCREHIREIRRKF